MDFKENRVMIYTDGQMDNFSNNWSISWTRINCIFSIFLTAVFAAEKQIEISTVVGSSVTLHCANDSNGNLTLVRWNKDKAAIFTYPPNIISNVSSNADFNKKMLPGSELYPLVISNVLKSDARNYTCAINTNKGTWDIHYKLIVTDKVRGKVDYLIPVLVTTPFVFLLMLIFTWILLRKVCKQHKENDVVSPDTRLDADCVYENYMEGEKRVQAVTVTNEDRSEICGIYH